MLLDNKYLLYITAGVFSFAFVTELCYVVPVEDQNFCGECGDPYQEKGQKQLMLQTFPF